MATRDGTILKILRVEGKARIELPFRNPQRELEVLGPMLEWLDHTEIARRLHVNILTAKTLCKDIYRKPGVSDLCGLPARVGR